MYDTLSYIKFGDRRPISSVLRHSAPLQSEERAEEFLDEEDVEQE